MTTMTTMYPTFLYVEDDFPSRKVMHTLLTKVLHFPELTVFESSVDFLDRVRALPNVPNIIFLDIQIGPYDGYEMLKLLRSDPCYDRTMIIAMTASVMAHDVEQLQKAGFSGLIGKPILKDTFPQLIEHILQGKAVWYVPE